MNYLQLNNFLKLQEEIRHRGIKFIKPSNFEDMFNNGMAMLLNIDRIVLLNLNDHGCVDKARGYEPESTLFVLVESHMMMTLILMDITVMLAKRRYEVVTHRHQYTIIINRHPHG